MAKSSKRSPVENDERGKGILQKLEEALALPFAEKLRAITALVPEGLYGDISLDTPDWLVDGTNFHTPTWSCEFGRVRGVMVRKFVNFKIQLANGTYLTDPENSETLKWIKIFLCIQINGRFNGGSRKVGSYELEKFKKALHCIDYFLMNDAKYFDIGRLGLGMISINNIKSFLWNSAATPLSDYLYEYPYRLTKWFRERLTQVTPEDIQQACATYPLIEVLPPAEDRTLDFSDEELIKVRTIIALNGWYDLHPGGRRFNPQPFIATEYRNTLHGVFLMPRSLPELNLDTLMVREYPGVPVSQSPKDGISMDHLSGYLNVIRKMPIVENFYGVKGLSTVGFDELNSTRLFELALKKYRDRFVTIPYDVLLHMLGNSMQFFIDNRHIILNAILTMMSAVKGFRFGPRFRLKQIDDMLNEQVMNYSLRALGVCKWYPEKTEVGTPLFFTNLREGKYLFQLYQVLLGSFLVILGSLAARRQSEIIDLDPTKCLDPPINPYLKSSSEILYCLHYDAAKTGDRYQRYTLSVGITRPLAKMIWDLMEFRRNCEALGVISGKTNLLLTIDHRSLLMSKMKVNGYNVALNVVCDYFQSPVVKIDGVERRYYLRQHQLRRFIALAFYHSSGGNIEAVRQLLGHADVEHVYTYLTENMPGVLLETVKAEVITDCLYGGEENIEGLEWLKQKIMDSHSASDFTARSIKEIEKSYEPLVRKGLRQSSVSLSDLVDQQTCLKEVLGLLKAHAIDLTPEFFVVQPEEGAPEMRFNLVLKISEPDDAR
ncbi:hypothetical protein [Pseudomonas putida]|uniref:hypothetical protein n=1 Tax=Pseudomonas putida TaxID=303 RepID=UPI0015776536|nr:hypothetical protein [Pseudomonas putida]NTY90442.1 hypothetical protein [Pseudomonas putida]NTY98984.1 hypothetical protein [Pseudomonas putida]NTZ21267.1 hypothetical protein [Pseudomonas putida]NTZ53214.1 hypothetical protein [Pseudomonas putida]NTZ65136.1 hypothetical protein [Pseudomonas putida]